MITLVKFYAEWCGPCKKYGPEVDKVAASRSDLVVEEVDIDKSPDLAQKYGVQGVPFTIFKDSGDNVLGGFQGAVTSAKLNKVIDSLAT